MSRPYHTMSQAQRRDGFSERACPAVFDHVAISMLCRCCNGRIVSALEGGYRIQGGIVSAFSRSVAAHVRALSEEHRQCWDPMDSKVLLRLTPPPERPACLPTHTTALSAIEIL